VLVYGFLSAKHIDLIEILIIVNNFMLTIKNYSYVCIEIIINKTNKMKDIKIDSGVTLKRKGAIYPFEKMKVGDSIYIELAKGKNIKSLQSQIHSNFKSFTLRNPKYSKWKCTTNKDSKGIRLFRTE